MFTRQIAPAFSATNELNFPWLSEFKIKDRPNVEMNGVLLEKDRLVKNCKSTSSYLSFGEKAIVAIGAILYSTGNAQESFNHKNNFSSNGILMQLINSVFPFLITNLGSCLSMLNNINQGQELLLQYQYAKDASSKTALFNRYQLMLKIGLRTAFADNPNIIKNLEPEFIDLITQLYFSGKTLVELNQSLNTALNFLKNNPPSTQQYWKGTLLAVLALTAMIVATFGAHFIQAKGTSAITGIIAAIIIASIMLMSHFLEHSTYLAPALKKQINDTLKIVEEIETNAEKIITGVFTQISSQEKSHLEERLEQLSLNEQLILLDKLPGQEYIVQPFSSTDSQEISWRFFKNMGRQAGENAWLQANQNYNNALQKLENIFQTVRTTLQTQQKDILRALPNFHKNMTFILSPNINFKTQIDSIYQTLQTLEAFIKNLHFADNGNFMIISGNIEAFKGEYLYFKSSQKAYNTASENMTYLQQSTVATVLNFFIILYFKRPRRGRHCEHSAAIHLK